MKVKVCLLSMALFFSTRPTWAVEQTFVKTPYYAEIRMEQLGSPALKNPISTFTVKRWSDGSGRVRVEVQPVPKFSFDPALRIDDFISGIRYVIDEKTKTITQTGFMSDFVEVASVDANIGKEGCRKVGENKFVFSRGTCNKTTYSLNPSTKFLARFEQSSNALYNYNGVVIKFKQGKQPEELFRLPEGYTRKRQ